MSRAGQVFVGDTVAGTILETDEGEYVFTYSPAYLAREDAVAASLTLPLQAEPYVGDELFPFFDGLIPEGWLLNLYTKNWKLRADDRMALLLAACRDCIGSVSVIPLEEKDEPITAARPRKRRKRAQL